MSIIMFAHVPNCDNAFICYPIFLGPLQGKEYVFVANSDNLGAIVDLSILVFFLVDSDF